MALYQCSIAGAGLNSASVGGVVPVFNCWRGVELSLGWREKNDAEKAVECCVGQLAPEVRLHQLHRTESSLCLNGARRNAE